MAHGHIRLFLYPSPQYLEEYDLFSYHQRNHQSIESLHHPQQCEIVYASICGLANSDHPTCPMAQIAPTARYSQQQLFARRFLLAAERACPDPFRSNAVKFAKSDLDRIPR